MSEVAFWLTPDWGPEDYGSKWGHVEPFWMREPAGAPKPVTPKTVKRPVEPARAVEWVCNQVLRDPKVVNRFPGQRIIHVEYMGTVESLFFRLYLQGRELPITIVKSAHEFIGCTGYSVIYMNTLLAMPFIGTETEKEGYARPAMAG